MFGGCRILRRKKQETVEMPWVVGRRRRRRRRRYFVPSAGCDDARVGSTDGMDWTAMERRSEALVTRTSRGKCDIVKAARARQESGWMITGGKRKLHDRKQ